MQKVFCCLLLFLSASAFAEHDPYYDTAPACSIDRGNLGRTGVFDDKESSLSSGSEITIDNLKQIWHVGVEIQNRNILCFKDRIITSEPASYDIKTGKKIWGIISNSKNRVALYKNKLYTISINYNKQNNSAVVFLLILDPITGKIENKVDLNDKVESVVRQADSTPPLIYNDIIIFSLDRNIIAYSFKARKVLWKIKGNGPLLLSADGKSIYFYSKKNLIAANLLTGKLIWKSFVGNSAISYPIVYDGKVYFVANKKLLALDATIGKIVWDEKGPFSWPLAIEDNFIISATIHPNDGDLKSIEFYNLKTGKLIKRVSTDRQLYPLAFYVKKDHIYILIVQNGLNKFCSVNDNNLSCVPIKLMGNPASPESQILPVENGFFEITFAGIYKFAMQ